VVLGVQQTFSMPGVYRNRKVLQNERIRLAQLQLQGSQYDLKREVRLSYLQIQYLNERERLLNYQDSIYQVIKISSKRFFEAGQINKLEELQSATQADQVRNELIRVQADLIAEMQIFRFYTGYIDTFLVESIEVYAFVPNADTLIDNVQQQILHQQIAIGQKELQLERSELLPQMQAGLLFPTTKEYERPVGYQLGITMPIWRRQNRGRIEAAQTSIEIARAQQELEQQRLNAQYRQALMNYQRELQSLTYYNNTALPQARAIIETSQRLFGGGQLNYIESLRNLQTAFDIFTDHLESHREYNEVVIQLNYLNGTL
jgi:outer membrane protein TolC